MIDRGKRNVIGVLVDAVDYEAALTRILAAAHRRRSLAVSALAVHGVMTGALDAVHRHRLNHLDLVVPDGQPVRWALNLLHGARLSDRVYGPKLTLELCRRAAEEGLPVFFYGSTREVLDKLAERLVARMPSLRIAGLEPSKFRRLSHGERLQVAERLVQSNAAITFVGLGCPRQETWVYEYRELVPMPLVAVGAAFDFHAGTLRQAPAYLQRRGLEWAYRLLREPRRLWRRYVYLNPAFLVLVSVQLLGLRAYNPAETIAPTALENFG